MSALSLQLAPPEHLSPHDLVTYFRCPFEMEVEHLRRHAPGAAVQPRTPSDVVPLRHSALAAPPGAHLPVQDGRLDVFPHDRLVYEDTEEEGLPILFADEQVVPEPRLHAHGLTLVDNELNLSGRPDLVIRRGDGALVPVEYKATHPFHGLRETHGRVFDVIQLFLECRLVEAATGTRPRSGVLFYGDQAGDGAHEGFVEIPYGNEGDQWVRQAVQLVRADAVRAPVPAETNCGHCGVHRDGLCRFAVGPVLSG
ncbi:MAG: PD-(D/E)XK nuclease family protein [Thermoplasmata archaeon]|nr:PD-(D/E)XK nuclease family protein [Thermoplasmata archaeon]MCI4341543.1 PD-(D/E)XK nuclease family protein [Thermoplasmata archaeon]